MKYLSSLRSALLASAAVLAVQACSPIVELRGNLPPPEQLALVKVGVTTRDEIQGLLGTPSNVTPFGDETWHYISTLTERYSFMEPEVKERKVITVVFDSGGIVRAFDTRGMEAGKPIQTVDRETPTAGKDMNIIQQMMGNVGRFSKPTPGK
ncbi:putative outer membrane lipoprotein [Candidatus Terasakiella magnetica]|nr:putative outer membrane lipoprotein [Candidatus Terasakiella magnetica]